MSPNRELYSSLVPATTFEATLPVKAKHSDKHGDTIPLISLKSKQIIMPGDMIDVPTNLADQQVIAEGWRHNDWPAPQLTEVKNESIQLTNHSTQPVILRDNRVNSIKITTTQMTDWQSPQLLATRTPTTTMPLPDSETIDNMKIGETTDEIKELLLAAHRKFRKVFCKNLTGGYNGHYGPRMCKLNLASSQRHEARKIPIANYDHELKGIL